MTPVSSVANGIRSAFSRINSGISSAARSTSSWAQNIIQRHGGECECNACLHDRNLRTAPIRVEQLAPLSESVRTLSQHQRLERLSQIRAELERTRDSIAQFAQGELTASSMRSAVYRNGIIRILARQIQQLSRVAPNIAASRTVARNLLNNSSILGFRLSRVANSLGLRSALDRTFSPTHRTIMRQNNEDFVQNTDTLYAHVEALLETMTAEGIEVRSEPESEPQPSVSETEDVQPASALTADNTAAITSAIEELKTTQTKLNEIENSEISDEYGLDFHNQFKDDGAIVKAARALQSIVKNTLPCRQLHKEAKLLLSNSNVLMGISPERCLNAKMVLTYSRQINKEYARNTSTYKRIARDLNRSLQIIITTHKNTMQEASSE